MRLTSDQKKLIASDPIQAFIEWANKAVSEWENYSYMSGAPDSQEYDAGVEVGRQGAGEDLKEALIAHGLISSIELE